jgi:hypothetical protein
VPEAVTADGAGRGERRQQVRVQFRGHGEGESARAGQAVEFLVDQAVNAQLVVWLEDRLSLR